MLAKFEQFIRERQYLHNVSPATVAWHTHSLKWMPSQTPTDQELKEMVVRMREKGLRATGCNSAIRSINAFLHWSSGATGNCHRGCQHPHIQQMKEPQFVPQTFAPEEVKRLIEWKPTRRTDRRLHLLTLILLDVGARISELLNLRVGDVDLDNLLLTLTGKGRKQRRVPMSLELRKAIFKYLRDEGKQPTSYLLSTLDGGFLDRHIMLRDVKRLCRKLGFEPPPRTLHAFRHTAACNYIRRGGSVFHLQKMLGHTSLEMSRRYANLNTDDLSAVHQRISLLGQ